MEVVRRKVAMFIKQDALTRLFIVGRITLPMLIFSLLYQLYAGFTSGYHLFLCLGAGGTPQTFSGYVKVTVLRLLLARRDVLVAPHPSPPFDAPMPYFQSPYALPLREAPRPKIAGIAPQRQISQRADTKQVADLQSALKLVALANTDTIIEGKSCFEQHSHALFLNEKTRITANERCLPRASETRADERGYYEQKLAGVLHSTCGLPPEVAHMHGSEGSMHLTLHPEDAACVIERGWGERHPLAGCGGLMKDISMYGMKGLWRKQRTEGWLPRGFVMVYAPRTEKEREVIGEIVKAGAWWVGGVKLIDPRGLGVEQKQHANESTANGIDLKKHEG